jgi:3-phytase
VDSTDADGYLTADVEGLAIYYMNDGAGYLIASSQGNDTFTVYERAGDNRYLGTFRVIESDTVDAVSESDGIDVTNFPLNVAFPEGLFVTQDDRNIDPDENQNFKLVSWRAIADALALETDVTFDPRQVGAE